MKIKSDGLILTVGYDEDPIHPRKDCDNLGTLLCWHSKYNLGDDNPYADFRDFKDDKDLRKEIAVQLPVYLYDHSGITISTAPFSCRWDSGQAGIIYATKDAVIKEFGDLSEQSIENAEQLLREEVKEYDDYLTGEYYFFVIEDENENWLDSCCGFRGNTFEEALKDMKAQTDQKYAFLFDNALNTESGFDMC